MSTINFNEKKWDTISANTEFLPNIMKSHYNVPVFLSTYSNGQFGKNTVRVCLKCNKVYPLEDCSNCGYYGFVPGITTEGSSGIFCEQCGLGFSSWTCKECGTINPVNKSLAVEKSGCFIATAVYGSPYAEEVVVLKEFRDNYLLKHDFGKLFVKFYYSVSPPIAQKISKNGWMKNITKTLLIIPLIKLIDNLYINENRNKTS